MSKYRFDQIVTNSTAKKKPISEDKHTYLGLEHLDPGSLQVTRYGSDVAPIGEKLIMRKGDVLFGKRRAYQKKVAIAPFDGIFSAHGMVLRPKEEVIDKSFFPFFISSEYFLDAAIKMSVGSLSPTINWRDLKVLEFELPEMDKQRELAKVLWAMDTTKKSYYKLLQKTDELVKSQFIEIFGDLAENPNQLQTMTLQELLDYGWVTYHLDGNHGSQYPKSEEFVLAGVPYISANSIVDGKITFSNAKYVTHERAKRFRKGIAQDEDVLFAHNATVGPVSILHTTEPVTILGTSLTAYRCNKDYLLPAYLKAYMESWAFVKQYESEMQQTTRKQVPITTQRKYKFVVPPIELQEQFSTLVEQSDKSKSELKQALVELSATNKKIISENLG